MARNNETVSHKHSIR